MTKHICKTCKWAEWRRTETGRIRPKQAGRCTYQLPVIPLPISIEVKFPHRSAIWRDFTEECPCWEAVE